MWYDLWPQYYYMQEAEQKQEAERQLVFERKQAEASSEELQRKLEELKKELQERDAQVYYTSHNACLCSLC